MLILLILLDICLLGRSQTTIVYFKTGNNATLVCPLNTPEDFVIWRNNEDIINDANNIINHRILNFTKYKAVSNESNRNMLHIQMANEDEIGEYWCETNIDNKFKTWYFRLMKIDVPNVSVIVTPNSTVYEGTCISFECMHDVKNSTVVNWLKDGKIIQSLKLKLVSVDNITRFDAGVYSCRVIGNSGQYESENVSLTILYSPKVFVVDYNNGTLFCNASGYPDKYNYAQWEHVSSMNNHIRYINGSKDGHLYITDLDRSNGFYYSGIYTCFAENSVLRHDVLYQSGFKHIEFKGLPQCFQDFIFKHGIKSESTEISIELYSVPQYDSFNWKTLTGQITNTSSKYDIKVTGTHFKTVHYRNASFQVAVWKFSLVIYDLNLDDFGIYLLQVANEIGNTSCSVRLEPTSRGYLAPIVIFMFACGAAISVVLSMLVIQHFVNSRKIARHDIIRKPSNTDNQAIVLYRHRAGQEFTEIMQNQTDRERTLTIEED